METIIQQPRWYDRLAAAYIFFTRLPFWRIYQPPQASYQSVVEYWPLTGWLTAGIMAAVLFFGSWVMPYSIAVLAAIIVRLLLTGALHEDGLADFFDGFGGGGSDRQRVLAIMKDSHIGTYGVLALIGYMALLFSALYSMPPYYAALTILAADPFAKMLASELVMMLPYARTAQEAKSGTVYRRMTMTATVGLAFQGLLPIGLYCYFMHNLIDWQMAVFLPAIAMYFLYYFIWRRLKGYTGDCCGAVFLLTELAVYLVACYYIGN